MNNELYYLLFFVFIGFLIVIFYSYQQQQEQQYRQQNLYNNQVLQAKNNKGYGSVGSAGSAGSAGHTNRCNDHIKLYEDTKNTTKYKRATANDVNESNYTYNIKNIDIHKDTINNNNSKLGNPNNTNYDPELEEVYNTPLRGVGEHPDENNEIYGNNIKPNKTDLPIVNPPLQLLKYNAPLRLSERHLM
jgi:hypothetical protein